MNLFSIQNKMIENAELLGAIARGYCHPVNSSKILDPDLCSAIAEEMQNLLQNFSPNIKEELNTGT
jgi:hypothetical protein